MCKDTSLLQRSNISIEKPVSPLALQRSAMFEVLENGVTNLVPKTLRTHCEFAYPFLQIMHPFLTESVSLIIKRRATF